MPKWKVLLNRYGWMLLIIVALLPAMVLRDFTPDNELRYLSIADEALRNGNLFTFYNQGVAYADKPPLYLWAVMLGRWLLGSHYMWFIALFSLIPSLVIIDTMDRWVANQLTTKERMSGRLMLITTGLFLGLTLTLRMDMLMCMFITLALYTFYKLHQGVGASTRDSWLFPTYLFLAVFTKGPMGIIIPLLSTVVYLAWTGEIRLVKKYWGWKTWGVLLLLSTSWFWAVYWEGGSAYLNNLLFHQTIDRAIDSFHHKEPFYYYGIAIWYSLAPWSLLILGVLVVAIKKREYSDLERFFMTVFITTFLTLSVISSKIAIYLAPSYPFIIYWTVLASTRIKWNRWYALSLALPASLFFVAPILLVLKLEIAIPYSYWSNYIAVMALAIASLWALWALYKEHSIYKAINRVAIGLLTLLFFAGFSLPLINQDIGFQSVCKEASELAAQQGSSKFYTFGIRRPESMDVFLGQDIEKKEVNELTEGVEEHAILITTERAINENKKVKEIIEEKPTRYIGKYRVVAL